MSALPSKVTIHQEYAELEFITDQSVLTISGLTGNPFVTLASKNNELISFLIEKDRTVTIDNTITGRLIENNYNNSTYTVRTVNGDVVIYKPNSVSYPSLVDGVSIVVLEPKDNDVYCYHVQTKKISWKPIFYHYLNGTEISSNLIACIKSDMAHSIMGASLATASEMPSELIVGRCINVRERKERYAEESMDEVCVVKQCSSAFEVTSTNVTKNVPLRLQYETQKEIKTGNNYLTVMTDVKHKVETSFLIDLQHGESLAKQLISYDLTVNYPNAKHVFYDANQIFICETQKKEHRIGSTFKVEIGTTSELKTICALTEADESYTVNIKVMRTRNDAVLLRKTIPQSFTIESTSCPLPHYYEENSLYISVPESSDCEDVSFVVIVNGKKCKRSSYY